MRVTIRASDRPRAAVQSCLGNEREYSAAICVLHRMRGFADSTEQARDSAHPGLQKALGSVLDWLLPGPCVACGRNVEDPVPTLGLCRSCLGAWPLQRPHRCSTCGREIASTAPADYRCGSCRRRRLAHQSLTVGWPYVGPVAASLRAIKFHRLERLGPQVVDRLLDSLAANERAVLAGVDAVTAVPLWRWRLLRRGYNQAEILGRRLAQRLDIPYASILMRHRGSRPQSQLARAERRANVRGSMRIKRRTAVPRSVLLVDDVVTTGSTLEEAARVLRAAGVRPVHCLAIARTPDP